MDVFVKNRNMVSKWQATLIVGEGSADAQVQRSNFLNSSAGHHINWQLIDFIFGKEC